MQTGLDSPSIPIDGQGMLDDMESYKPRPISRKLSRKERNYISYCEQYYHTNKGEFPTTQQAAFALRYSVSEINVFLQNQQVISAFMRRGLDLETLLSTQSRTYLSGIQVACAMTVANFADTRPVDLKLEQLGVSPVQYYSWLKSPAYQEFVNELADQALDNVRPEAVAAFAQLLRSGDIRALKMYFEMTGQTGESTDTLNLKLTLQRVVEAVARHVQDPTVLAKIATEVGLIAPVANSIPMAISSPSPSPMDNELSEVADPGHDLHSQSVSSESFSNPMEEEDMDALVAKLDRKSVSPQIEKRTPQESVTDNEVAQVIKSLSGSKLHSGGN